MGTDDTPRPDLERLNAFVDGELAPSERAAVAARIAADRDLARTHATLARLKACIGESADATPPVVMATPRKRHRGAALGLGLTALAACAAIALYAAIDLGPERESAPRLARDAVVTLAALPASPVIPNLDAAGLALEDMKVDRVGELRLLVASYRGPHGCRLDLSVRAAGTTAPASAGTSRHGWEAGGLAYELVAHGMPGWRFALIADAAERETREGATPDAVGRRLREARAAAPPCTG
jgi:anti-sigma factor RsiW